MRVGILVSSIGNFGQAGFYNAQEIGLAKALDALCDEVKVYKLVTGDRPRRKERIRGCSHAVVTFLPAKHFGINGMVDTSALDGTLDAMIYFSDTQFSVPRVSRWARKNRVALFPYIGVVESHSTSRLKKSLIDRLFVRNLKVYKQCQCFAKTNEVKEKLKALGVDKVTVTTVGLDEDLLQQNCRMTSVETLKKKYGFAPEDKVLLFIGRLTEEKRPVEMIELFADLVKKDDSFRLLMVGSGELSTAVTATVARQGLKGMVFRIERIPNSEIWELYRMAAAFVNLNRQEIFGMAILEAMYYGCKVVAWNAPGPDCIIENGVSGWLVSSGEQAVQKILDPADVSKAAHNRVVSSFLWKTTADKMMLYMRKNLNP